MRREGTSAASSMQTYFNKKSNSRQAFSLRDSVFSYLNVAYWDCVCVLSNTFTYLNIGISLRRVIYFFAYEYFVKQKTVFFPLTSNIWKLAEHSLQVKTTICDRVFAYVYENVFADFTQKISKFTIPFFSSLTQLCVYCVFCFVLFFAVCTLIYKNM